MQGIAARRIASSSMDDSGKKFVDVSFNAGPLGLNVVWHDKARAVVVQGFRRVDGEWRAEEVFSFSSAVCPRPHRHTFSHSSPTVQTGYPSSVTSTTPRRTSPHLTLPIPFPHLTTLAPVSTSTSAFAPAP